MRTTPKPCSKKERNSQCIHCLISAYSISRKAKSIGTLAVYALELFIDTLQENISNPFFKHHNITPILIQSPQIPTLTSKIKKLLQLPHRILRTPHTMPHRPTILIDLIIISPLVRLIPKEMNSRIIDTADLLFFFKMLQAVCLVPAGGEDVEGDLAADGETMTRRERRMG